MSELSILIIYGGRDTINFKTNKYFEDINVLNLVTMTWSEVQMKGTIPIERVGHCAFVEKKKLLIFGGVNDKGFLSNDLNIAEFD